MGMALFLLTATVEAILAQRLVRRVCTQCREVAVPTSEMLQDLELTPADIVGKSFYRGKGCDACNKGYDPSCPNCDFYGTNTGNVCGHQVNLGSLYF